ncbi:MAG: Bcr/CflA family drug resistance efflux transporter [Candidatus Desulfobacillus denitrificans]|jgi:sugar phosphate permease|uniref:Lysosomal dipeptide transporter MFSD1 n=1 Tax=Candidatus Desulfobacillus denitrificans TaxID=2608985 RepID=A0A809RKR9_9PROT|nr:MFS transporter [Rhodocyclaceae bacterium]BBO20062.1 MFS transporter [Candidatus Desulfobacillus denitrificans]GIK46614.1 MAG: MFS transporter [Betaproteobacteria bacterium]GJQ56560.1 MAG: MFS transporter [Rhodocyclaceae bacterium]
MIELTESQKRLRNLAMLLALGSYLMSMFHRVAPAAIARDLAAAFEASAASLGALAATYFYVYTVMQVPVGVLADTLGPRKILALGGLVAGAGSLLFGLAPTFDVAVVGRTLVGLGVSVAFIAMLKLIAVWYEERRFATLTGTLMFLGNVGTMTAGAPLAWAAQGAGWRSVFIAIGVMSLAIGVLSWFLVQDRPGEKGAMPRAGARADRTAWLGGLLAVMKNRATWPGFFVNVGVAGSFFAFAGLWAVPYFTQVHGMTRAAASNHITAYFGGFALGCLIIGPLSDRLRRRKPLMIGGAVLHALGWWLWLGTETLPPAATYALCIAMGTVTASLTLSWACAKEVNPPLLSGMATSVVNVGVFLGPSILQPLVGWVMDRGWQGAMDGGARLYSAADYRTGLLLMAAFAAFGAVATLFVRETGCRNVWRQQTSSLNR